MTLWLLLDADLCLKSQDNMYFNEIYKYLIDSGIAYLTNQAYN